MRPSRLKRVMFWTAVAGVSVLANTGVEIVATRWPHAGFSRFVAFTHKGFGAPQ